jgi:LPS-assembly protein
MPNEQGGTVPWQRRLSLSLLFGAGKYKEFQAVPGGRAKSFTLSAQRTVYLLITTTVLVASHPHLLAQQVTTLATPTVSLPDAPGSVRYPVAEVLPPTDDSTTVLTEEDTLSRVGNVLILDGDVKVTYRDRIVTADHIEFNQDTRELTANGHLHVSGGPNHEDITASHGTMNLTAQTARFYDVTGSVGLKNAGHSLTTYANSNPFLFTGRMVVRTGPENYEIYDGTLTTCQLPDPDWMLYSGKFTVDMDSRKAKAQKSVFRLMNIPLLFLPYVTQPVDAGTRQSGFLIPTPGYSSSKGFIFGEQYYWAINRSADLTVGTQYYSLRGWEESASFRYRGLGNDFAKAHYSGLQDRGITTNGVYLNQGGEDVTFSGRHDFSAQTRVVADAEYLSSYAYREAFAESFSLAVSSDILSIVYGVHEADGYSESLRADRYQGLKMAAVAATFSPRPLSTVGDPMTTSCCPTTPAIPEQQVRIFHAPSLDFSSTEHEIGRSGLQWSFTASQAGLSRVQSNFSTGGLTQRLDLHPEIAYPLSFGGWRLRSSVGVRETVYSRSRQTPYIAGAPPIEIPVALNRADVEAEVDLRAPVIERTFDSAKVEKFFHGYDVKHTIEPEVTYRYVAGIDNFLNVLRFDDVDVASDTNELEYGATQRIFLRPLKVRPCRERPVVVGPEEDLDVDAGRVYAKDRSSDPRPVCGSRELISWRLTQKYFFDENFGGAVIDGRRNIFDTTLNLSGIAFLTEPRAISPLISRMRVRTSEHLDVEWDFDLDTGAKKFTSNNLLLDVHENNIFAGLSYAKLNAPGRFFTEGVSSSVSNFNQLRLLLGYGSPTKAGLGVAANVGLDLRAGDSGLVQYGALQGSYNWDCCGFSVEVRKYELGSVRNETSERFNFTLLNIGTAGNLRRAASLF